MSRMISPRRVRNIVAGMFGTTLFIAVCGAAVFIGTVPAVAVPTRRQGD
jgi:hypothetical protein